MASKLILALCAAALVASCSWSEKGTWKLIESGYSIDLAPYGDEFAMRVHVNELKQRGGEINSAEFRLFVSERLKRHGICSTGWEPLPCLDAVSCTERTRYSVTIFGRCLAP